MDFIFWHRLDVLFFSQSQQHQQHFGIRQRLWGSSDGNGTTSSTRSTAFRWLFTTSTTHLWYTSTSASELTERKFQWVLNGVKSEGNQANSRKMYEHLVIVFSLSVLLWDIFLGGAYDQGIIICINLMYQDMVLVSVVKDESLAFGHKSQKMGVLQVVGEIPHDTSSDLGYLSTNHAESWLKNQRCRWRVWRCDSWVLFFPISYLWTKQLWGAINRTEFGF